MPDLRQRAKTLLAAVLLAAVAGGLHAVGWVYPGLWWAVWLGQIGFVAIGMSYSPGRAFWLGLFGGTLGICAAFYWGVAALKYALAAPPYMAWLLFMGLTSLEGLSLAIFCFLTAVLRQRDLRLVALAPFAWAAIEHWYPRVFPWQMAYSQLEVLPLLQIAELVGSVGVGFVMTAVCLAVVVGVIAWRSPRAAEQRFARVYCTAAAGLLAFTLVFGVVRQQQWTAWGAAQPKLKLGLIQMDPYSPNGDTKLQAMTEPIVDGVDLVCWPESALGTYTDTLEHFRDRSLTMPNSRDSHQFLEPGKGLGKHLLAGAKLYKPGVSIEGPYSMAALLISPELDILGRYKKRTLLPFGEYVPFETTYPAVREWFALVQIMEHGKDPRPLPMVAGQRLGVMLCYEDTLPHSARETVAAGANVLITLIQGAAFENPLTLKQHLRLATMRAVENRRYFARCASTGVTCFIDPTGRVVSQLPLHTEEVLVGEVAVVDSQTLYTRLGSFFPWTCTALVALGLVLTRRLSPRQAAAAER